jgi:hypothetical protein
VTWESFYDFGDLLACALSLVARKPRGGSGGAELTSPGKGGEEARSRGLHSKRGKPSSRPGHLKSSLGCDPRGSERLSTVSLRDPDQRQAGAARTGDWFMETNLGIARLDKDSRNEGVKQKLLACDVGWDLVVCDEAHKMSATFFGGERSQKSGSLGARHQLRAWPVEWAVLRHYVGGSAHGSSRCHGPLGRLEPDWQRGGRFAGQ